MADTNTNDNSLYRKDGMNKNTYKLLFEDNDGITEDVQSSEFLMLLHTIQEYTKWHEKLMLYNMLRFFFKNKYIDMSDIKYDPETKEYKYVYNGEVYTFDILSKYIQCDDNNFILKFINNYKVNKELHSEDRYGKCHCNSILLAKQLDDSKILTGYINVGNYKVLHSVVVANKKGVLLVYDWTQNLIMPLDEYRKIFNFVVIEEVGSKVMLNDLSKLYDISMTDKVYLTFRDEIINDLGKNEEIFNNNKNK